MVEATSTLRDLKVILIGGSPMSGKTTLAMTLAARFDYACMSTDDIGEIISTVADVNPMKGVDYRAYYIRRSILDLVADTSRYHQAIRPAIDRLIETHSTWGTPIIIEGWALYPGLTNTSDHPNTAAIWLVSDLDVLAQRLADNEAFSQRSADGEQMRANYLQRSIWHNAQISTAVLTAGADYIMVTRNLTADELAQKATELLAKKAAS